jgi:hypothetical protein
VEDNLWPINDIAGSEWGGGQGAGGVGRTVGNGLSSRRDRGRLVSSIGGTSGLRAGPEGGRGTLGWNDGGARRGRGSPERVDGRVSTFQDSTGGQWGQGRMVIEQCDQVVGTTIVESLAWLSWDRCTGPHLLGPLVPSVLALRVPGGAARGTCCRNSQMRRIRSDILGFGGARRGSRGAMGAGRRAKPLTGTGFGRSCEVQRQRLRPQTGPFAA